MEVAALLAVVPPAQSSRSAEEFDILRVPYRLVEIMHLPSSLHRCARQVKRLGRLVTGRDVVYRYDARPRKVTLGSVYGGWVITPEGLNANSVVYSFGVGNDISFDLEAISEFGLTVHGFDPSPEAVRWITARTDLPPQYNFHSYGLGAHDGIVSFFAPAKGGMYSLADSAKFVERSQILLPVKSLSSIRSALGTDYIDVLKMDIEGAEYDQIDAIIENRSSIGQLLIEFHHRTGAATLKETVRSVDRLRRAGFALFHVSGTSSEFSFARVPA
jgi:FkbM family methyltransferase